MLRVVCIVGLVLTYSAFCPGFRLKQIAAKNNLKIDEESINLTGPLDLIWESIYGSEHATPSESPRHKRSSCDGDEGNRRIGDLCVPSGSDTNRKDSREKKFLLSADNEDSSCGTASWSNCGKDSDLFEMKDFSVLPDSPVRGENLTVSVKGVLKKPIEGNESLSLVVKYGPLKLYDKTSNLCDEAAKIESVPHCPIEAGELSFEQEVALPDDIPPGAYLIRAAAYSESQQLQIFCVSGKMQIPSTL